MSQYTRKTFDEVMIQNYVPADFIPVKGKGCKVWDQQGRDYIDFTSGIAVNALGHCPDEIVDVLKKQSETLWHSSNWFTSEPTLELASKLVEHTFAERVMFANSGGEANEAALKLARRYAVDNYGYQKDTIISFKKSFHGRTLFTVSVGGQAKYSDGFGPKPAGIVHLPFNDLDAVKAMIDDHSCAVIVEPIQGESGIIPATKEFLQGLRRLCDENNALLIFDEVQTGVGRTGYLYAYESYDVVPDILTSSKALANGFPISAILTTTKIAASFKPGVHGTTFGGNPLACAVGAKVIETIANPAFLENVQKTSALFISELNKLNEKYHLFNEVRGQGLLIGAELIEKYQGKASEFVKACADNQLMILVAGPNVLRFAPALNISQQEVAEGFKRLDQALQKFA
ncbi:aspartate aminotransferase family protein [Basfia succiniciproducens]|uniref:aspartate aminotransferase family protein n=1 Tax=Basfia succiniciproducens TaxID=653940 RepID=UPI0008B3FDB0|nr:aspartate aminotransferase family protein [Basfia succiniciproducens]SEQ52332.1 acetylornithine aminotransferase apoenzyme [Basfia succiniciproducens]